MVLNSNWLVSSSAVNHVTSEMVQETAVTELMVHDKHALELHINNSSEQMTKSESKL